MTHTSANIWMHIGAGSFHRAHQAWYLHRLLQQGDDRWHIALGNIRDDASALLSSLSAQQGEYTLETVTPEGERRYEKITSIKKILPWDAELSALIAQGSDAATKVIAFTVTEGGYYLDPDHQLDPRHPDIQADINGGARTLYGALTRILQARLEAHGNPVTLLNCDNLRHNGERFRHGFLTFLRLRGETRLLEWVTEQTTSPNTMVDRITPRPTADIAPRVLAETGFNDAVPVMGEAFIQWVIEDDFIAGRPALENVDVELVTSVLPWEEAKIRILNASHSCIAWAGTLIGQSFIHQSTQTQAIKEMAWEYVTQDVIPSLTPSPLDLEAYRDVVLARFANPYIQDTNQRVAADGLSKIPGFITPTLVESYQRGDVPRATAVLPALFYLFLQRWHDGDLPYSYQDGALDESALHSMLASDQPLAAFAADAALFGPLATKAEFATLLQQTVSRLQQWAAQPQPVSE
ncbi:mannitol dehydrogenase family protein [Erwiniaceae bacterium BAC15a-03b]|uniref:Mannitol dehydrogenase family protein n=1 Tax=Winslowiella arboricola TaxID=2978220 RepID=A0A9J6PS67_9GAMM|nr:D-arabinitol 4-dehydrogenase [Winslowiella arboricola]MCU5775600.1 mannitol dehydrogenase family protein [Winslowiella arboricola]MCU5779550.1 mannitol dehydrogenase family protein [Winslowiella arboricola]